MSNSPFSLWAAAASDATFTDPAACAAHASEFERRIARRNRIERIAGWIQLPVWGGLAAFYLRVGEVPLALSTIMIGIGVLVVLRNLTRRADNLDRHPEEPCRDHLVRQYRRQYEALLSVPLWYIGPILPGLIAFLAAVTFGIAEVKGWDAALADLTRRGLFIGVLFCALVLLNWYGARRLKRDLERLERLA